MTNAERMASRLLDAVAFDQRIRGRYDRLIQRASADGSAPPVRQRINEMLALREQVITPELLRPHMIAHYVSHFTLDELSQLVTFYESPVGQKYVTVWSGDDGVIGEVMKAAMAAHSDNPASSIDQQRKTFE
ncbi:MAG: DUF2059 domain-containing protein [bacterium]